MMNILVSYGLYKELNGSVYQRIVCYGNIIRPDNKVVLLQLDMYNNIDVSLPISMIFERYPSVLVLLITTYNKSVNVIIDVSYDRLKLLCLMGINSPIYFDNIVDGKLHAIHLYKNMITHPINFSASRTYISNSTINQQIVNYNIYSDEYNIFEFYDNNGVESLTLINEEFPLTISIDVRDIRVISRGEITCNIRQIKGKNIIGRKDFSQCIRLIHINDNRSCIINDYILHPDSTSEIFFAGKLDYTLYDLYPGIQPYCTSHLLYNGYLHKNCIKRNPDDIMTLLRDFYPIDSQFDYSIDYSKDTTYPVIESNPHNAKRLDYISLSQYDKTLYNIRWWTTNKHNYITGTFFDRLYGWFKEYLGYEC